MKFRLEQWVMPPPDYDKFLLRDIVEEWQAKYIFEPFDAHHHKHDNCPDPIIYLGGERLCSHPVYNLFYIQLPKKFAKTTILAGLSFEQLIFARPGFEGYILAGKKDQAGLLYKEVSGFFDRSPRFFPNRDYLCHKDTIYRLGLGGRRIGELTKMSREAFKTSGIGPDWFIFDEFWNQPDRELWDVVYGGVVAKRYWRGAILTNAGFDTETICYEIREICRKGEIKNYYYYEPGVKPKQIPKPKWINKDELKVKERTLPPNVYQRWHENKWTSKHGSAFPVDKVKTCINKVAKRQFGGRGNYVLAIDAGTNRANFVAILAHREGKIKVDAVQSWKGKIGEDVPFPEIGDWIEDTCRNFQETVVLSDPWQMKFMLHIFENKGIAVKEFTGSEMNAIRLSSILRDVIVNEYIEFYPEAKELIADLKKAEMEQRQYGWRLSRKFDFAICLGMACVELMSTVDEEGDSFDFRAESSGERRKFGDEVIEGFDFKKYKPIKEEVDVGEPLWKALDDI